MILQNQVRCNKCGDKPYSAHVHDFKYCKCGSVAVDGGMDYLRRIGDCAPKSTTDISIEVDKVVYMEMVEALDWAEETGRNELGTVCAIFRVLRDNGYDLRTAEHKAYDESKKKKSFIQRIFNKGRK